MSTNPFVSSAIFNSEKQLNATTTVNGAQAFKSTLSQNLDFFSRSGNLNYGNLVSDFNLALDEDSEIAIKNLLHMRDPRNGKGIRSNFRLLLVFLASTRPHLIIKSNLIQKIVENGRWDDLFVLVESSNPTIINLIVKFVATELKKEKPDSLLFKWLPINVKPLIKGSRLTSEQIKINNNRNNLRIFVSKLRSYLRLTPSEYRKFVSTNRISFIPEYKFCNKQWTLLDYSKIPSQCFQKNKKSFARNDQVRFSEFIQQVLSGDNPKVKINTSVVWPHEVVGHLDLNRFDYQQTTLKPFTQATEAQWKSLPNFVPEGLKLLPIIDTSSSMLAQAYSNYTCLDLSIILGIYLAENNSTAFKDLFLTFNTQPCFISLKNQSSLYQKIQHTIKAPWGGSTNIEATFQLLLEHAVVNEVSPQDMPDSLVILSDCQFNRIVKNYSNNSISSLKAMYKEAGYTFPTVIFWNLNNEYSNVPVTFDEHNTVLVSGYSPVLIKSVFENNFENLTPLNVMLSTLFKDSYNVTYY